MEIITFNLKDQIYGCDLNYIVHVIDEKIPLSLIPKSKEFIDGIINYEGKALTILNLERFLNLPKINKNLFLKILVIDDPQRDIGFSVGIIGEILLILFCLLAIVLMSAQAIIEFDIISSPPSLPGESLGVGYPYNYNCKQVLREIQG